MAEIWGAALVAGAAVAGGYMSSQAAKDAGRAAGRGADAATNESARQYDQTRRDLASGRALYTGANNALARLSGFGMPATEGDFDPVAYLRDNPDVANDKYWGANPEAHYLQFGMREGRARPSTGGTPAIAAGAPDMSGFFTSPDYNFRRDEGTRGLERTAAASGGAFSGNALRALAEFNSNLASNEFGNYFNRLTTMAGLGSAATNQTAAYGAEHAANAGRNALAAGEARASGITGSANAWGNTLQDLGGLAGYYSQNRGTKVPSGYGGTGYGGGPYRTPGYGDWMYS
jgi:hypothetical protein